MIINCSDADSIAAEVAGRIRELKADRPLRVALTGGTLGIAVIAELAKNPPAAESFKFVFGDERFVSLDDPERNEAQGLGVWPGLSASLLRYPDGIGDLMAAREGFEAALGAWLEGEGLDLVILGMGPDGHVASLFPGANRPGNWVVAEPASPKPPARRLSLSYSALSSSRRVWFVISGSAKSAATACSYHQKCELPAARVRGEETLWFVDEAIAQAVAGY